MQCSTKVICKNLNLVFNILFLVDSLQPNNDVDERDVVKRTKNEIFLELLALLCPLLVEIGTSSVGVKIDTGGSLY